MRHGDGRPPQPVLRQRAFGTLGTLGALGAAMLASAGAAAERGGEEVRLCALVRARAGEAAALQGTWGVETTFVEAPEGIGAEALQGEAAGLSPLWRHLGGHDAADGAAGPVLACRWYILAASARVFVNWPAISALLPHLEAVRLPFLHLSPLSAPAAEELLLVGAACAVAAAASAARAARPATAVTGQAACLSDQAGDGTKEESRLGAAYVKLAYGSEGCPPGRELSSQQQCLEAIQALGLPAVPEWTGTALDVPRFCAVREFSAGDGHHSHWNLASTGEGRQDLAPVCLAAQLQEVSSSILALRGDSAAAAWEAVRGAVETGGYQAFARRVPDACLLAVLGVAGRVHMHHIHDSVQRLGMANCTSVGMSLRVDGEVKVGHGKSLSLDGTPGAGHDPVVHVSPRETAAAKLPLDDVLSLPGPLCIFVAVAAGMGSSSGENEAARLAAMARAAHETWATPSTIFLLPPEDEAPPGLEAALVGLRISRMESAGVAASGAFFSTLQRWRHAISIFQRAGTCQWAMKVALETYAHAPALENRLACFNASMPWYLGATTGAYRPGNDPFIFPSEKAGTILSKAAFADVKYWAGLCTSRWVHDAAADPPYGSAAFLGDFVFALCLAELGGLHGLNYADINGSFIMMERPAQTLAEFEGHPDTMKQCLLGVGLLGDPAAVRRVHERVTWSAWHRSIPCIGESEMGKYAIIDLAGNQQSYYDERIRLALYYCKAPGMLELEKDLSARLDGADPRAGAGSLLAPPLPPEAQGLGLPPRRHLCIFVPSSARQQRFVEAAEAAWRAWGTLDTFFVATERLSPLLDAQTLFLEGDVDTDYARLPVRTFRIFEALGRAPEWSNACDWYMKADADSFLNVPLVQERLRCFQSDELWYLGVPQVAHGASGTMRRFGSGGAGYAVSRALLSKVAAWAPFCLLELLQHAGGTGMEDVSFANCLWKWGRVGVTTYIDTETEAITSEAALNRTGVAWRLGSDEAKLGKPDAAAPCCTFVAHSLAPSEVAVARENVARSCERRGGIAKCPPDAERLRRFRDTVLMPLEEEEPAASASAWEVYNAREFAALLACSGSA